MKEQTQDELLARVCAAPEDDAPRLVYADWLSERGDPRGELIQLQCLLKNSYAGPQNWNRYQRNEDEPATLEIARSRRAFDLMRTNISTWLGPLAKSVSDWRLHRGFFDRAGVDEEGVAHLPWLFEREPVVRIAYSPKIGLEPALQAFLGQSLPARVTEVLIGKVGGAQAPLLEWPALAQVRDLTLYELIFMDDFLIALAALPGVRNLEHLGIVASFGSVTDVGVLALAQSPNLPKLRSVRLRNVDLKRVSPAALEECSRRFTLKT